MIVISVVNLALAFLLAPLLLGIINRTKAFVAGRNGQPVLQAYYDLWKLLNKGATYSRTTTWIFRAGPIVGLACVIVAVTLMPFGGAPGLMKFPGDIILFAYVLGLMRFFTVLAAMDTGSSFEGMGASREVQFSALAEPALLLGLAGVARTTDAYSLSTMFPALSDVVSAQTIPVLALIAAAFVVVFLTENARIPVDDPNTHLELTMIHEVMVLDHSGPDFAFILYGAALKLWVLGALVVNLILPVHTGDVIANVAVAWTALFALAIVVGIIESSMARLRLVRVPLMLAGAVVLSGLAFVLLLR